MPRRAEISKWVGKHLFEVTLDDEQPIKGSKPIPEWIWIFVGFAGGYFWAALVVARHWGWLP
jgi:hypothetical protein